MSDRWIMVEPAVGAGRLAGAADAPIPVRADRAVSLLGSTSGVVDIAGLTDEIALYTEEQPASVEQLAPSMVRLSQLAVDDAIEAGDWSEAVRLARRCCAWAPENLQSLVSLGHALHGAGAPDQAVGVWLEATDLARRQDLRSPMLWLLTGRALQEQGRTDEAIVLLDELLAVEEHAEVRDLRDSLAGGAPAPSNVPSPPPVVAAAPPPAVEEAPPPVEPPPVVDPAPQPVVPPPVVPPLFDQADHPPDPPPTGEEEATTPGRKWRVGALVGVVALVAAAVVGFILFSGGDEDDVSSPVTASSLEPVEVPGTELPTTPAPTTTIAPTTTVTTPPTTAAPTTVAPTTAPPPTLPPEPAVSALTAFRLLDSRAGQGTFDGAQAAIGRRAAGQVTAVDVAGRGGIPVDATAAVLNIAAVTPDAGGFVTAYPCDVERPSTAALLYAANQSVSSSVTMALAADGTVCVYSSQALDLVVDTTAYMGPASAFRAVVPARLVDSRAEGSTVDGAGVAIGRRGADQVTPVSVAGRGGIPVEATSAVLNIAAVAPDGGGFVTAYPCDVERPNTATLLFGAVQNAVGSVTTALAADGTVCIYSSQGLDLIVETTAYVGPESTFQAVVPARLVDTRAGEVTVDGADAGIGRRAAEQVTTINVAGRGGVPADATVAEFVFSALTPDGGGFLTAYPCDVQRPSTATVVYDAGQNASSSATIGLSSTGTICVYTTRPLDLIVDVTAAD